MRRVARSVTYINAIIEAYDIDDVRDRHYY